MKNCLFQYWSNGNMVVNSDLITEAEANELFDKYSEQFKADFIDGLEPVMAFWVNNTEASMYSGPREHWDHQEFMQSNGELWRKV